MSQSLSHSRRAGARSGGHVRPAPRRRRMAPQDRERLIVEEATRYFADSGLSGGTIELARRLGITQPLLYRYFPTKQALIERVFDNLFPSDKAPEWEALIDDHSIPLNRRLKQFYKEFSSTELTYEHVRLFLFSGLSKAHYNTRYYDELTERIFVRIAKALRQEAGDRLPFPLPCEISEEELELVQSLHASIYHVGFRRWVHTPPLQADIDRLIDCKVDWFLDGAMDTMRRIIQSANLQKAS